MTIQQLELFALAAPSHRNQLRKHPTMTKKKKKIPVTFELDSFPLPDGSNAVGISIALGNASGHYQIGAE